MSSATTDRNVEGILRYMEDYFRSREQQVVRINPRIEKIIPDITWLHLQILKQVLQRSKAFGGEKYRVADVLAGADDGKRKALLSMSGDQSSIMDELLNRSDESKKNHDNTINDMPTLFRAIDPSLECMVHLIQHWMKWDLADAADLHHFDEQVRRLKTLRSVKLTEDLRNRYRPALGKTAGEDVTDEDVLRFELRQLEVITMRFAGRRQEDKPFELIVRRDEAPERQTAEPYDYKARQLADLQSRGQKEQQETEAKLSGGGEATQPEAISLQN